MRRVGLGWLMGVSILVAGCSIKPGNLQITPRDEEVYHDPAGTPLAQTQETKHPVAILVAQGKSPREQALYRSLDAALTDAVSGMAFFTVVERSNLGALAKEQNLESLNDDELGKLDVGKADYLITAQVTSANVVGSTTSNIIATVAAATVNSAASAMKSYKGKVQVDYRFYEKATNRVILTKSITANSSSSMTASGSPSGDQEIAKLADAIQQSAKLFTVELGSRYAPLARVVETRGEGHMARITIGGNYGLNRKAKVQFFEYADNSDIVAGATRDPRIVGYGKVVEVDQDSAWVEVDDYKEAKVLRGHYVKLVFDQPK